ARWEKLRRAIAAVDDHHTPLAQVGIHVDVLPPVALPALARRRLRALAPLAHAPVHDDADTRVVAEFALEVFVELRVVPRDDEDLAELHHLFAAPPHPERHVHAAEQHEGGDQVFFGALAVTAQAHDPPQPHLGVSDHRPHAPLLGDAEGAPIMLFGLPEVLRVAARVEVPEEPPRPGLVP